MRITTRRTILGLAAPLCLMALALPLRSDGTGKAGAVEVSLCDGTSTMTIEGLKPGEALPRERAQQTADQMMQIWRQTKGEEAWVAWSDERDQALVRIASTSPEAALAAAAAAQAASPVADQPTKFSARDKMLWAREEKKWIDEGYKLYHSTAWGGTIGISCDMCHPDGANTHPETYPKYQSQLKKVALLRDMINWCIENPGKGKPLAENDPMMRAMEAYILSTRKGVPMEPGKH
ncbi:MAG: cytochrome C [Vicinamibacteria bacterium]|nr:cytochrome C [Vicinamibacteria bacterium]